MRGHIKGAARANIANDHATLIFLQLEDTELFWIFTQEQQVAEANLQLVLHLHYLQQGAEKRGAFELVHKFLCVTVLTVGPPCLLNL